MWRDVGVYIASWPKMRGAIILLPVLGFVSVFLNLLNAIVVLFVMLVMVFCVRLYGEKEEVTDSYYGYSFSLLSLVLFLYIYAVDYFTVLDLRVIAPALSSVFCVYCILFSAGFDSMGFHVISFKSLILICCLGAFLMHLGLDSIASRVENGKVVGVVLFVFLSLSSCLCLLALFVALGSFISSKLDLGGGYDAQE